MEGVPASNKTILVSTRTTSVYVGGQIVAVGTGTIQGNAFSVSGNTFTVTGSSVGINISPTSKFHVLTQSGSSGIEIEDGLGGGFFNPAGPTGYKQLNISAAGTQAGIAFYTVGGSSISTYMSGISTAPGWVGIGSPAINPTSTMTVNGRIESKSGGYLFPDGTLQVTAGGSSPSVFASSQVSVASTDFSLGTLDSAACVTGSSITLTTRAVRVGLIFKGGLLYSGFASKGVYIYPVIDGGADSYQNGGTSMLNNASGSISAEFPASFYGETPSALSAGSHTFCISGAGNGNTGHLDCAAIACKFQVVEVSN